MGEKKNAYGLLVGKRDVVRRIFLKLILEKYDAVLWTGLISLRIGTSGGLL
jgi:hypothetical protein